MKEEHSLEGPVLESNPELFKDAKIRDYFKGDLDNLETGAISDHIEHIKNVGLQHLTELRDDAREVISDENKLLQLLNQVLEKSQTVLLKLSEIAPDHIAPLINDIATAVELLREWVVGNYEVDMATIITIVAAFLYFILPQDLIPDYIPGIGYLDDALVLVATFKPVGGELNNFKDWKETS